MKTIHHIYIKVFLKYLDDDEHILNVLKSFLPEDLEKEKVFIEEETVHIDDSGIEKMKILRTKLSKERHTKKIIELLKEKLSSEELKQLREQDNRIDDEGNFFFRLSKPKLLKGRYELTDGGDCFHFKIQIAAYPKNKENATKIVQELFKE